ncbi:hypothetical protein [Nocardioides sp.]|uniref:hypothetical protein n=1 Tax=Nocardioides sp. TaxID=35761 RepID=UPI00260C9173|nr:hypothetical protein [Nocardioides sp.]
MSLTALHSALAATDLLTELEIEDGFIHGETTFAAAGVEVVVNVDPDPEEEGREVDAAAMVERTRALLGLSAEEFTRIVGEVADEIDAALEEEEIEKVADLRVDLTPVSLIVLPEGAGLVLLAPTQLPNGAVTVILDDEREITEIQLQGPEGGCGEGCACGSEGAEGESFTSVEELIGSLSTES